MAGEASGQSAGGQRTQGAGEQRASGGRSGDQERQQQQRGQASMQRRGELGGMLGWPTPFGLMRRLFDDMERLADEYVPGRFGPEGSGRDLERIAREGFWVPRIDVLERDAKLVVRADLPGMSKQDVRCDIEGDQLVIEGEREREVQEERGGRYRSERAYGAFRRAIPLPEGADVQNAEARFDNGVLEVTIPLPQEARARRIDIQEGKPGQSVH